MTVAGVRVERAVDELVREAYARTDDRLEPAIAAALETPPASVPA